MSPERVIIFIIGTLIVLLAAYYVTYFIGMKASGKTRAGLKNRNIKILDRYSVARDKQFYIIEIASKIYVLGITNQGMTVLDTFEAEEFAELIRKNGESVSVPWNMTPVGKYGNRLTRKVVEFVAVKTGKKQEYDAEYDSQNSDANDFASKFENAQRNEMADEEVLDEGMSSEKIQNVSRRDISEVTNEIDDALSVIDSLSKKHDDEPSGKSDFSSLNVEWTTN